MKSVDFGEYESYLDAPDGPRKPCFPKYGVQFAVSVAENLQARCQPSRRIAVHGSPIIMTHSRAHRHVSARPSPT